MICFRDMTFCGDTAKCKNEACPRRLTDQVWIDAREWWGGDHAPVSVAPFSSTCTQFQPIEEAAPA